MAEETPPRYCSVCHHELKPEDYLYCPKCGTPLMLAAQVPTPEADRAVPAPPQPGAGSPAEPAQEQPAQEQTAQEQLAQRGWWRRHPILSGSLGIIVVLFVFISVVGSLGGGGGGENSAKGGAGGEHKKSTGGGTASTNARIVFRRYLDLEGTRSAIFTMYPNGSHIRQITNPPEGWGDFYPAWSPDGTKVAFNRRCHSGLFRRPTHCKGSRILLVDVNTGVTRSVTHCIPNRGWTKEHPPPSSAPYCVADSAPAFSPDGKKIAFRRVIGPEDESSRVEGIFIVGLDGSDAHQVTNVQKRGALEFKDYRPAFSPDGKMLVFERTRLEDDRSAVFVQSLDSSGSPEGAHRITPWKLNCGDFPQFSPNANWVLFSCDPEGDPDNLYWVHPDGTGLDQLTHTDADKHYWGSSFSPEFHDEGWGDIVAARWPAYGDEDNSDVLRMHIEHSDVQSEVTVNLTKSQNMDDAPSWGTYPPSARE